MDSVTISVEKFAVAGEFWTQFKGSDSDITIVFPNGKQLNMVGLLHIANARSLEGFLEDSYVVSTYGGPTTVPAGTKITIANKHGVGYAVRKVR